MRLKTNLQDNIWIVGFDTENQLADFLIIKGLHLTNPDRIYCGETSEISEGLAKECVHFAYINETIYVDYSGKMRVISSAKESILSACDKKYCVILKIG